MHAYFLFFIYFYFYFLFFIFVGLGLAQPTWAGLDLASDQLGRRQTHA